MVVDDQCGAVVPLPERHPMSGCTWMSSTSERTWHLVPAHYDTFRIPCECGRFRTGRVHRRLWNNPPAGNRCAACASAVSRAHLVREAQAMQVAVAGSAARRSSPMGAPQRSQRP